MFTEEVFKYDGVITLPVFTLNGVECIPRNNKPDNNCCVLVCYINDAYSILCTTNWKQVPSASIHHLSMNIWFGSSIYPVSQEH